MISHIMVGATDVAAAKKFYDATMEVLGNPLVAADETRLYYSLDGPMFIVTAPRNGEAASGGNGSTIGFRVGDTGVVDAWHATGMLHGGRDGGAPGPRDAAPGKYVAYLIDPGGNKLCVSCDI